MTMETLEKTSESLEYLKEKYLLFNWDLENKTPEEVIKLLEEKITLIDTILGFTEDVLGPEKEKLLETRGDLVLQIAKNNQLLSGVNGEEVIDKKIDEPKLEKKSHQKYQWRAGEEAEMEKNIEDKLNFSRKSLIELKESDSEYADKLKEYKDFRNSLRDKLFQDKQTELDGSELLDKEKKEELDNFTLVLYEKLYINEALKIQEGRIKFEAEAGKDTNLKWAGVQVIKLGNWYRKLPLKYKVGFSAALFAGTATFGAGISGVTGFLAAASLGQRALGALATGIGTEALIGKGFSKLREKDWKNKVEELKDEISKKIKDKNEGQAILSAFDQEGEKLSQQVEKELAGLKKKEKIHDKLSLIGGVAIGAMAGIGSYAYHHFSHGAGDGLAQASDVSADHIKMGASAVKSGAMPTEHINPIVSATPEAPVDLAGGHHLVPEAPVLPKIPGAVPPPPEALPVMPETFKVGGIDMRLPEVPLRMGSRGPEGAIIDYLKANGLSKDEAGKQASQMFHKFMKSDGVIKFMHDNKLNEDSYLKLMKNIEKGSIRINPDGTIKFSHIDYVKDAFKKATAEITHKIAGGEVPAGNGIHDTVEVATQAAKNAAHSAIPEHASLDSSNLNSMSVEPHGLSLQGEEHIFQNMERMFYGGAPDISGPDPVYTSVLKAKIASFQNTLANHWVGIHELAPKLSKQGFGTIKDMTVKDFLKGKPGTWFSKGTMSLFDSRSRIEFQAKLDLQTLFKAKAGWSDSGLTVDQFLKKIIKA
ncbi:hypothetical protein HY061_02275 [Candidatus Azambacteria bacterium]|nr:hypothetical protein [Candidatus Azambacteria bacterium]